jgi:drug/metabolite transporter (DMT)-like permease
VGLLLVAASAVAWSTAGLFMRLMQLDVWTILFWRGLFGGLAIVTYMITRSPRSVWSEFSTMGWQGCLVGALSAAGMIAFVCALQRTTVANVSLIYAASPFATALLARIVLREPLSILTLVAASLAIIGVAVMFEGMFHDGNMAGMGLSLVMTIAASATTVTIRKFPQIPMVGAVCLAAFLGSALSSLNASPLSASSRDIFYLALFGACQMGLGLVLFVAGCRAAPPAAAAVIGSLETPLAPLWVWLAFNETPAVNTLIGGAFILVAVVGQMFAEHVAGRRPRLTASATN